MNPELVRELQITILTNSLSALARFYPEVAQGLTTFLDQKTSARSTWRDALARLAKPFSDEVTVQVVCGTIDSIIDGSLPTQRWDELRDAGVDETEIDEAANREAFASEVIYPLLVQGEIDGTGIDPDEFNKFLDGVRTCISFSLGKGLKAEDVAPILRQQDTLGWILTVAAEG